MVASDTQAGARRQLGIGRRELGITTCGKPTLVFGGQEIVINNRKSIAVLAYLANTVHGSESRERLAGLLWSESSEHNARASLRQTIGDLRDRLSAIDPCPFTADRLSATLDLAKIDSDLSNIRQALKDGVVHPVLLERPRIFEDFLAGFDDLDPSFRTWLIVQRQCLHDYASRRLEELIATESDLPSLRQIGLALLNLDPTHELCVICGRPPLK